MAVVTDNGHNRIEGVPVTFTVREGGGSFAGQPSLAVPTDRDGRAFAVLTLGMQEGIENQVVEVTFPGNPGSAATFVASGRVAGDPAQTSVSGVVLDNTNLPIEGVTVTVQVGGNLGSDDQTHLVVGPSETNSTYAVTDQGGLCCDPVLAHVFGGPNAQVAVSMTHFIEHHDQVFSQWELTVPAGQTVILMQFALQQEPTNPAKAEKEAQALTVLKDPHALHGMSPEERAQVVNFTVP